MECIIELTGFLRTKPSLARADGSLGPIGDLKLIEDIGDMVAHRLQADDQRACDLLVGRAVGQQMENLAFTLGQLGKLGRVGRRRKGGELAAQPTGNLRSEERFAVGGSPNRAQHGLQIRAFQQITARARPDRGQDRCVILPPPGDRPLFATRPGTRSHGRDAPHS